MTSDIRLVKEDDYEEMAATYQCIEIARLNEVLKQHGITDRNLRQQICTDYAFESGCFLDSGWLKSDDTKVYPELCFSERPLDPVEGLGEIETLHVPSAFFSFHEYAHGGVSWYFDEHNENDSEIEMGIL